MLDLGNVRPGSTVRIPINTFDSNDPSASVTASAFVAADVEIYKDGSTTQRASDAGYTVSVDFDTATGRHIVEVDLADNTTAGFFAAGSEYHVAVGPITVDAATLDFFAARFWIGYPDAIVNTTIATLASQTSFTLTAGSADNDAYNGWKAIVHDVASAVQLCIGYVSDYTGSTKTVTLAADPGIFTMAATDNISLFPPDNVQAVAGTTQTAGDLAALITTVDGNVDTINTATAGLGGAAMRGTDSAATAANLAVVDTVVDAIKAVTDLLPDGGALNDLALILADTGTDGVVVASINTNAMDAAAAAADLGVELATAIWAAADTITLPGQEAPPLAPTPAQLLGWLYKVLRNRKDQTATLWQLYADNETTVDAKATLSDDGTTAIAQEIVTGP